MLLPWMALKKAPDPEQGHIRFLDFGQLHHYKCSTVNRDKMDGLLYGANPPH